MERLPQMIQDIADLPEGASSEGLNHAVQPLHLLFANAIRYTMYNEAMDDESPYNQITTSDGKLKGVWEIGIEGFDTGGRDYRECILTTSDGNHLIIISLPLHLPGNNLWNDKEERSIEATEAEKEKLLDEQTTQLLEFVRTITLLN